ncbi:MAG TPA: hypothetical protein VKA92_13055 [Segetibacter sp.]|nr:hypothetical protein [Segetibacter sp.]
MKLKPGGKIAIFLVLGGLAFFLIKNYLPQDKAVVSTSATTTTGTGSEGSTTSGNVESNSGNQQTKSGNTNAKTENRTFDYTPEKPVNGKLRGVVEVGASGFNSFVINMDNQKRWEIISKDFGESLAYEGLATTDDIRSGLKKYLARMFEKGVLKTDMHFVISSGAQKEPKTALISNELKKMGYVVNLVTPEQEGKFAFKATVPPSFQDNSFLVDIGSGNTKISWQEGTNLKAMELPGAKYYEKGTSDDAVYNQVKGQGAKIPEGKRNVGFIIGGVPFTLAKQTRNGEERYTVLNAANTYKAEDKKMEAGLNIYKGLVDATKCDTFVFDWDANFTIGFLLSLR